MVTFIMIRRLLNVKLRDVEHDLLHDQELRLLCLRIWQNSFKYDLTHIRVILNISIRSTAGFEIMALTPDTRLFMRGKKRFPRDGVTITFVKLN